MRREAEQWKDQYTRLEKARARQEEGLLVQIEEWRDQYRRVEKERSRLSVKLEELVQAVFDPLNAELVSDCRHIDDP